MSLIVDLRRTVTASSSDQSGRCAGVVLGKAIGPVDADERRRNGGGDLSRRQQRNVGRSGCPVNRPGLARRARGFIVRVVELHPAAFDVRRHPRPAAFGQRGQSDTHLRDQRQEGDDQRQRTPACLSVRGGHANEVSLSLDELRRQTATTVYGQRRPLVGTPRPPMAGLSIRWYATATYIVAIVAGRELHQLTPVVLPTLFRVAMFQQDILIRRRVVTTFVA